MNQKSYKLRSGVAGVVFLPGGGTMEVTIPAGSVVFVVSDQGGGKDLTEVQFGNRLCAVPLRELQKCGAPFETAHV
jgi:hypothetical protein